MNKAHIIVDEIIEKFKQNPIDGLKYIDGSATDHILRTEVREEGRRDTKKVKVRDSYGK